MKEKDIKLNRKHFIELVIKGASAFAVTSLYPTETNRSRSIKAIAFDAFTLFDTGSIYKTVEELFPGKAKELMVTWRTKQFEYTWLRGLSKQYKDFWIVTGNSLKYATDLLNLELTEEKREQIMQSLTEMRLTKDACIALNKLKQMSIKLSILSNATPGMLNTVVNNSAMQNVFDFIISTDSIKTYKPDPAAYQMAVDKFKLNKEEILFVAFGGWDAAGAKSFGYQTVWMNTLKLPVEQLDVTPDFICEDFAAFIRYVKTIIN
jgi:2-haloacid dehalogenase